MIPRRILLVDDYAIVRSLTAEFLRSNGFEIHEASSPLEARQVLESFDPDLVILDINFGDGPSGIHVGHVIKELNPSVTLMYLTAYPAAFVAETDMPAHVRDALVVSKHEVSDPQALLVCIETALRGKSRTHAPRSTPSVDQAVARLTRTQIEVLKLVAMGWTNVAIAKMRKTQERAVEKQLKSIYSILGIESGSSVNARVLAAEWYVEAFGVPTDAPKPEDGQELADVADEVSESQAS